MKSVFKALAVVALVASSQFVLAEESAFPIAAESNVGQPPLDTYADQQARLGRMDVAGPSAFPLDAEANVGEPPLDTYADRHARNGTIMASSGSPFPIDAESSVGQPPLDTYADRYARFAEQQATPSSARADVEKWSVEPSSMS